MILIRYKRNQFRKIQKNQRRGTSGLSETTFRTFMMTPLLKNNQKREGLFIKGD